MKTEMLKEKYGKCNLVVKGIDPKLDDDSFYQIFNTFGPVKSAKLLKATKIEDKVSEDGVVEKQMVIENTGIGFVLFLNEESARDVII